jgi:hypothetical protein
MATELKEQMDQMLRDSEAQLQNNDTSRYKEMLSLQENELKIIEEQLDAKERQFFKM